MSSRGSICALAALILLAAGCGGDSDQSPGSGAQPAGVTDPGPVHVHGLGVNPKDGALFVASHTGLFRVPEGESTGTRVADRFQDTMGFTVVGPDRFLGSGHPDSREDLPPFLGLIRSTDAGKTWDEVSLMGKSDFHMLEASGKRVYGFGSDFETRSASFLVSSNGGNSWDERDTPGPLVSLAIDPEDPERVVAAAERGLYSSDAAGKRWRKAGGEAGLLAWAKSGSLFLVDGRGRVNESDDEGRSWSETGEIGGQPAAFEAAGNDLYAALHDGTIKLSTDGGRSWTARATPPGPS